MPNNYKVTFINFWGKINKFIKFQFHIPNLIDWYIVSLFKQNNNKKHLNKIDFIIRLINNCITFKLKKKERK